MVDCDSQTVITEPDRHTDEHGTDDVDEEVSGDDTQTWKNVIFCVESTIFCVEKKLEIPII